ncbi:chaperone modulator CbpM [Allomuricauda sp. SCSIO 64092]
MVRLHKELDINPEGLHAIHQLLKQIHTLEQEVELLQRKLRNLYFYR